MKTLIEVKENHIAEGKRQSAYSCPIAKALQEKCIVSGVTQEGVDFGCEWLTEGKPVQLPEEAVYFIQCYDANMNVRPFSFYLDIPDEYLKPNN